MKFPLYPFSRSRMTEPQLLCISRSGFRVVSSLVLGFALAACSGGGDEEAGPGGRGGPGGGRGGFGMPAGGGGGEGTEVPVEVAEILPGNISAFIETNGILEAEREVDIVARTGGPLVELSTEEGRTVQAGQLLARVDEAEARAQVEIARVSLQQAELALGRAQASFENQVVSQEVYDTAVSTFESAKAQLEGSEIQLGYTRIEAPFGGLIIERAVKLGETVTNGQRLFRVSDFDPLLCTIGVPERDLSRLSVGQPAMIEVEAFPGEQFEGRVLRVSPVVEAETGTIRVTLEVDRQGRLSPGMFATVRLVTDVRENALIMPKRALSLESLADSVFVVDDGVAYRRNITLGYEEDDRVEVTDGLSANDRVIVVGQDGLTDATPVQILAGPGAEEAPPRRAAGGFGGEMTPERRAAITERMRAGGMTDEQIEERLAAMAAGGGPMGGRAGGAPGASPSGGPPGARPEASSEARSESGPPGGSPPARPARRAEQEAPPAEPAPAPAAAAEPAPSPPPAATPPAVAADEAAPPSAPVLSDEQREAIRSRMRTMGMSEEEIERRLREGWGGRRPGGARPGGPPGGPMTPEQIEALRERLRAQGLSEEQIEARIARRQRPRS